MKVKVYTEASKLLRDLANYYSKHQDRWLQGTYVARKATAEDIKSHNNHMEIHLIKGDTLVLLDNSINSSQLNFCDPRTCCFCAVGGIRHLGCESGNVEIDAMDTMRQTIRELGWWEIESWNDRPNHTVSDIIAGLRKAAKLAKAQEADTNG